MVLWRTLKNQFLLFFHAKHLRNTSKLLSISAGKRVQWVLFINMSVTGSIPGIPSISEPHQIWSLALNFFCWPFSNFLNCAVNLFMWALSLSLINDCGEINFPLNTTLAVFHKFMVACVLSHLFLWIFCIIFLFLLWALVIY